MFRSKYIIVLSVIAIAAFMVILIAAVPNAETPLAKRPSAKPTTHIISQSFTFVANDVSTKSVTAICDTDEWVTGGGTSQSGDSRLSRLDSTPVSIGTGLANGSPKYHLWELVRKRGTSGEGIIRYWFGRFDSQ